MTPAGEARVRSSPSADPSERATDRTKGSFGGPFLRRHAGTTGQSGQSCGGRVSYTEARKRCFKARQCLLGCASVEKKDAMPCLYVSARALRLARTCSCLQGSRARGLALAQQRAPRKFSNPQGRQSQEPASAIAVQVTKKRGAAGAHRHDPGSLPPGKRLSASLSPFR